MNFMWYLIVGNFRELNFAILKNFVSTESLNFRDFVEILQQKKKKKKKKK